MHLLLNNIFDVLFDWYYFYSLFSNILLLVYQRTNEFCLLNSFLAILLNSLVYFNSVSEDPFGFFPYILMPSFK